MSSRKAQALKIAMERKRQKAKIHSVSGLDYSPLTIDKLQPEIVSPDSIGAYTQQCTI